LQVLKKQTVNLYQFYINNTLLYEAPSATELIKETKISPSTVSKSLNEPTKKVFKVLNISHIGPTPNIIINKVDAQTLIELIAKDCTVGNRTTWKVNLTLIDHTSNEIHTFSSSSEAKT